MSILVLRGDADLLRGAEADFVGGGRIGCEEDGRWRRGIEPSLLGAGCCLRGRPRPLPVGASTTSGSLIFFFPVLPASSFKSGIMLGALRLRGRELEVMSFGALRGANERGFVPRPIRPVSAGPEAFLHCLVCLSTSCVHDSTLVRRSDCAESM